MSYSGQAVSRSQASARITTTNIALRKRHPAAGDNSGRSRSPGRDCRQGRQRRQVGEVLSHTRLAGMRPFVLSKEIVSAYSPTLTIVDCPPDWSRSNRQTVPL
jgi:hypothetical protein